MTRLAPASYIALALTAAIVVCIYTIAFRRQCEPGQAIVLGGAMVMATCGRGM